VPPIVLRSTPSTAATRRATGVAWPSVVPAAGAGAAAASPSPRPGRPRGPRRRRRPACAR
jgi:hypothetical protein